MTEHANAFKFATAAGAERFMARLSKRSYEKSVDLGKPGSFRFDVVGSEVHVRIQARPGDLPTLQKLATDDRRSAGEPPARRGPPPKVATPAPAPPPPPAPKVSTLKKKAASAAKADVARKEARRAPVASASNHVGKQEEVAPTPSPLAAVIAELEAKRDRFQAAIDGLRTAEKLMAEA